MTYLVQENQTKMNQFTQQPIHTEEEKKLNNINYKESEEYNINDSISDSEFNQNLSIDNQIKYLNIQNPNSWDEIYTYGLV